MLATVRTRGHGFLIVLPDLLSSICFKMSHGLLSRVSESNQAEKRISESTRLFSSREDETTIEECSSSSSAKSLDTLTLSEELLQDFDRFVESMDGVSNGAFLRVGEESEFGSDWVELEWLKEKVYYSIESFVANRLEVALRLAWLNSVNGKKRGVKLKEKVSAAGVAANVFWRKKGCVDWWENLDASMRKEIFPALLGKEARHLKT